MSSKRTIKQPDFFGTRSAADSLYKNANGEPKITAPVTTDDAKKKKDFQAIMQFCANDKEYQLPEGKTYKEELRKAAAEHAKDRRSLGRFMNALHIKDGENCAKFGLDKSNELFAWLVQQRPKRYDLFKDYYDYQKQNKNVYKLKAPVKPDILVESTTEIEKKQPPEEDGESEKSEEKADEKPVNTSKKGKSRRDRDDDMDVEDDDAEEKPAKKTSKKGRKATAKQATKPKSRRSSVKMEAIDGEEEKKPDAKPKEVKAPAAPKDKAESDVKMATEPTREKPPKKKARKIKKKSRDDDDYEDDEKPVKSSKKGGRASSKKKKVKDDDDDDYVEGDGEEKKKQKTPARPKVTKTPAAPKKPPQVGQPIGGLATARSMKFTTADFERMEAVVEAHLVDGDELLNAVPGVRHINGQGCPSFRIIEPDYLRKDQRNLLLRTLALNIARHMSDARKAANRQKQQSLKEDGIVMRISDKSNDPIPLTGNVVDPGHKILKVIQKLAIEGLHYYAVLCETKQGVQYETIYYERDMLQYNWITQGHPMYTRTAVQWDDASAFAAKPEIVAKFVDPMDVDANSVNMLAAPAPVAAAAAPSPSS